jgi:hypothetical protein
MMNRLEVMGVNPLLQFDFTLASDGIMKVDLIRG